MLWKIAHRGGKINKHDPVMENSFEAFAQAIKYGADFIETDLRISKDNHIVLMHDSTIDRTTSGKGYVKDFTVEELKRFGVPTFQEALTFIHKAGNGRVRMIMDVKIRNKAMNHLIIKELSELDTCTHKLVTFMSPVLPHIRHFKRITKKIEIPVIYLAYGKFSPLPSVSNWPKYIDGVFVGEQWQHLLNNVHLPGIVVLGGAHSKKKYDWCSQQVFQFGIADGICSNYLEFFN